MFSLIFKLLFCFILISGCKRIKVIDARDKTRDQKIKMIEGEEEFQNVCKDYRKKFHLAEEEKEPCKIKVRDSFDLKNIDLTQNKDFLIERNFRTCPKKINETIIIPIHINYKQIPLCENGAYLHLINKNNIITPYLLRKIINNNKIQVDENDWLEYKKIDLKSLGSLIKKKIKPKNVKIPIWASKSKPPKCWFVEDKKLIKALKLTALIDQKPYEIFYSQNKIHKINPQFFKLNDKNKSSFRIYKGGDKVQGNNHLQIDHLYPEEIQNSLCSKYISLIIPINLEAALSKDKKFIYSPGDPRFEQALAFYSIASFRDLVKPWFSDIPKLHIYITNSPENKKFGPYFSHPEIDSNVYYPSIFLPDTMSNTKLVKEDKYLLVGIRSSLEPMMHEASHLLGYLAFAQESFSLENKALHEGIADTIPKMLLGIKMKVNNSCFSSSICTEHATYLCTDKSCLRDLDNKLKVGGKFYNAYCTESSYNSSHHKCSQFVSGFFWDLKEIIGARNVMSLLSSSLTIIPRNDVDFNVFFEALFTADKMHFKQKYFCSLKKVSDKRNIFKIIDLASVYPSKKSIPECNI